MNSVILQTYNEELVASLETVARPLVVKAHMVYPKCLAGADQPAFGVECRGVEEEGEGGHA